MIGRIVHLCGLALLTWPTSSPADEPLESSKQDSAIHVPTPPDIVAKMLEMAEVNRQDVVYDLGCGDGRIVIAAAEKYRCRAVGFDIDGRKVEQSRANAKQHRVERLVRIEQRDIFQLDLRPASVVTLYLLPEMNEQLIPQLEKLKDGSRIVCHEFPLGDVEPSEHVTIKSQQDQVPREIYLYRLPLKRR